MFQEFLLQAGVPEQLLQRLEKNTNKANNGNGKSKNKTNNCDATTTTSSTTMSYYTSANPPPFGSELERLRPRFFGLFSLMMGSYCVLKWKLQFSNDNDNNNNQHYQQGNDNKIWGIFRPASQYCTGDNGDNDNTNTNCSRSDLFAFAIVSLVSFCIMGGWAFIETHIKQAHRNMAVPQTPAGRCFGYFPTAEWISIVCFTYQIWDFVVSLTIKEHCTAVMMIHHVTAAIVSGVGLFHQYMLYYGFYFFGLSEVSSVFLVLINLDKHFPATTTIEEDTINTNHNIDGMNMVDGVTADYDHFDIDATTPTPTLRLVFGLLVKNYCVPLFAILFLVYRGLLWWPVSYMLFKDCWTIIRSGQAEKLRPGKTWVLYVLMVCNIPMGFLQLYWSSVIVTKVYEIVNNDVGAIK